MIQNRPLLIGRINAFSNRMRENLYTSSTPIEMSAFAAPDRITYTEAIQGKYTPIVVGHKFAPNWSTHWVKVQFKIPVNLKKEEVHLRWHTRSEGCVWKDGEPIQAFSPDHRQSFALPTEVITKGKGEYYIEVAVNNLFGAENFADRMPWMGKGIGTLELAEIACFRRDLWNLLMRFVIIEELAMELPTDSPRGNEALFVANEICNCVNYDDKKSVQAGIKIADAFLKDAPSKAVHQLSAIGHAHLDLAWLWPVAESKRKAYRTIATAIRNMDLYPEYKFVCSQMQIWEWVKEQHPKLYQKMLAKVKTGQLIPCGGSWVEPDCNLPSLESMMRQFMYGQRFMQKEFGFQSDVFWNPDVFGYSAQLPQILKESNIKYFLTQKMSWNQYNKFPHSSFMWEGLDGTQVLTHFPPADTYNCNASVKEVLFNVANHKSSAYTKESYLLYGFGDGGSGPTEEMLERVEMMKNVEGLPQVTQRTPSEFFQRLEKDKPKLHKWVGELYLELHRGCQTTQARNKWSNRKCENLLREVELLYAMNDLKNYPKAQLDALWKNVMLNQFHDIIPGSSIHEAYEVTDREYKANIAELESLKRTALAKLAGKKGKNLMVFNPHPFFVETITTLPNGKLACVEAAPMGTTALSQPIEIDAQSTIKKVGKNYVMENDFLKITFNSNAQISSLWDKHAEREVIAENEVGNEFVMYDDNPNYWDAWDIEAFYHEKRHTPPEVVAIEVDKSSPLRAQLNITFKVGAKSKMTQSIFLDATSPMLTFQTSVDWHEKHRLLKVEFPWQIHSYIANYEVPGGYVSRATHENTSWDQARFEVCGHRWADIAETGYGVALLNDSKYGYHTTGNRMRLSLLRGCTYPDEEADMGEHHFTYAVYPHESGTADANLHQKAALLNIPLTVLETAQKESSQSWIEVEGENIEFTAVKRAEDNNDIVVRFYETDGARSDVIIHPNFAYKSVERVNNLEEKIANINAEKSGIRMTIKPFEIITLRFKN